MTKVYAARRKMQRARPPPAKRGAVPGEAGSGDRSFPIAGIGASAGGLEALAQFLKHVPADSGVAFVVVQHLDPTHKGLLVELLQRVSPLPVVQASDCLKVEPDHVYVIPPNKDLSILRGVLHLLAPVAPRGLRLPIDFFFRALAEDAKERSIGIILSGMGSDGTLGIRAIKERGGTVFVQAPASAKFSSMPASAVDAGLADVVALVEELPAKILAFRRHTRHLPGSEIHLEDSTRSALEKIILLVRTETGHDFSLYKTSTLYRRIERRMGLQQIDQIALYVRYLRENPKEATLLFKELLIGVTRFFRDPELWEQLKHEVLPAMLAKRSSGDVLRAWVPGCATGEEAYSLAMVLKEAIEQITPRKSIKVQIFATDLDRDAIEHARQGFYLANIAADVTPERLQRFFVPEERGHRVGKETRDRVIFAVQNLLQDPPFTRLDFLSCRNLLIYLSAESQQKLVPLFHYSLRPGGFLLLGSAETIGTFTGLFSPLKGKMRVYRRIETIAGGAPVEFPSAPVSAWPRAAKAGASPSTPPPAAARIETLADQFLLKRFAPSAVLASENGDVIYVVGRTGKYLELAAGKASSNVFAMARAGLGPTLRGAFQRALRKKQAVGLAGHVEISGKRQAVNITIEPIREPEALRGTVLVVFADAPPRQAGRVRTKGSGASGPRPLARIQRELDQARDEARTTREEMQVSQEDLKSANEELQSANEELQSTNEELTTSKEEMQSMNEELQTLNQELQMKVDELSRTSSDMRNLLDSTEIATLFLDGALNIRRYTSPVAKVIKLIASDVGRPLGDLASHLVYPELCEDAAEVLRTLAFRESVINARDGRWFRVRIMPYRSIDNRIDGVVITFIDVTAAKTLEAALRIDK